MLSTRDLAIIAGPALLFVGLAIWAIFRWVDPAPPRTIVMSSGGPSGAYFAFAKRYADILANSDVTMTVHTSKGTVHNLARLRGTGKRADIALVQGGVSAPKDTKELVSLGRLYFEPLWIFYRGSETLTRLDQLKGKTLAIGGEGSGTRRLVLRLLEANGIRQTNARLLPISGRDAVAALHNGRADVIFLVTAPQAPVIQDLVTDPAVRLMSLARPDAYTRRFSFLSKVIVPEGVFDLKRNLPPHDVALLAPSAALVARKDLHPAIIYLLAQAAAQVHGGSGLFNKADVFPTKTDPEFRMAPGAVRFYKNGVPFFQRYLPFWIGSFVERFIFLALPIATLAIPFLTGLPALYRWRIRRRILSWYKHLRSLEDSLGSPPTVLQVEAAIHEVTEIQVHADELRVPLEFIDQLYELRTHVHQMRQRFVATLWKAEKAEAKAPIG